MSQEGDVNEVDQTEDDSPFGIICSQTRARGVIYADDQSNRNHTR